MSVGFKPATNAVVYWYWPGGRNTGITTNWTDTGDTFPNTPESFAARYGEPPTMADGSNVRANFPVDAETIFTGLGVALARAAQDPLNPWGLHPSGDGSATPLELHDFAATQCPGGWASSSVKRQYFDQAPPSVPGQGASEVERLLRENAQLKTEISLLSREIAGLRAELAAVGRDQAIAISRLVTIADKAAFALVQASPAEEWNFIGPGRRNRLVRALDAIEAIELAAEEALENLK
jgi:hypothetical protein